MGNHHWKKIAAVMLAAAIGIQPVYVQAKTREEIQQEREQKKSEQQGTQSQYKQSQSKVSSLEGQQDALEEEIQELDSQLVEVIASVSLMQDQISDTEKQIVKAQEDYDAAKAQEDAQYLAMKKRGRKNSEIFLKYRRKPGGMLSRSGACRLVFASSHCG